EWEKYRKLSAVSSQLLAAKPFESFYENADVRSRRMVENLFREMSANKFNSPVLIAGGFHTPQIADLLKKQNRSFVIVSPKITKVETASGSAYLSVFAREKTPLEKLFEGEKLFLNPKTQNLDRVTGPLVFARLI